ncbi:F-box protein [Cardamine amara subsp. amara]|uniref:F-box protein n=1 Tax=Cardamine amara subsp. amara TaxID=228776 RepID=A0ABD0ZLY1_CARAN
MHYLALVRLNFVLVSFDIISEEISVRQVPEDIFWPDIGLAEYGGNIAVLNYPNLENEGVIELWVVEDEEKNMWGSKTLVLHPSQMHMVNSSRLRVQGTTRNGEVIFAPRDTILFNIFLYDLQKNHMRKIEIKGTPNRHLTQSCEVLGLDDVDNLIYL